jgi:AraC-like DNA-binding protein
VPGVVHRDPERERAPCYAINFVESGSFRVQTTGAWQEVAPNRLFVTTPELEFSCAHEQEHPVDRCLSISYSDEAVESARARLSIDRSAVRPLTNRQAYLRWLIASCGHGSEARIEALAGALLSSLAGRTATRPLFRADRLSWYAARIDRAKAVIHTHYAQSLSLSMLAREVGMSLFHFARVFAELEGQPPHRFLTDVRLAQARARLRGGAGVTETCYAVGFGSLSHFVTTFRRRYGVRPSAIRDGVEAHAGHQSTPAPRASARQPLDGLDGAK